MVPPPPPPPPPPPQCPFTMVFFFHFLTFRRAFCNFHGRPFFLPPFLSQLCLAENLFTFSRAPPRRSPPVLNFCFARKRLFSRNLLLPLSPPPPTAPTFNLIRPNQYVFARLFSHPQVGLSASSLLFPFPPCSPGNPPKPVFDRGFPFFDMLLGFERKTCFSLPHPSQSEPLCDYLLRSQKLEFLPRQSLLPLLFDLYVSGFPEPASVPFPEHNEFSIKSCAYISERTDS